MSKPKLTAKEKAAIKARDELLASRDKAGADPWLRCAGCDSYWYAGQDRCNRCLSSRYRA